LTRVRLGIDFGTTRTVVARVEGGNYPLVTFEAEWGDGQEWYPSLIAGKGTQRVFGWEAWSKQSEEGWQIIRSLKRYLSRANPDTCLQVGEEKVPLVVRMRGTNVDEGMRLLAESGLPVILANDLKDAADKVVAARAQG